MKARWDSLTLNTPNGGVCEAAVSVFLCAAVPPPWERTSLATSTSWLPVHAVSVFPTELIIAIHVGTLTISLFFHLSQER